MTAISQTPAVEARGVRKLYGDLVAVEYLTITVDVGEILGVLVLTTLLAPTRGTFTVAGTPSFGRVSQVPSPITQ
jgi:ABC-type Na+ transport system ATPase subunit NatA